jgi:hypothetical protein
MVSEKCKFLRHLALQSELQQLDHRRCLDLNCNSLITDVVFKANQQLTNELGTRMPFWNSSRLHQGMVSQKCKFLRHLALQSELQQLDHRRCLPSNLAIGK